MEEYCEKDFENIYLKISICFFFSLENTKKEISNILVLAAGYLGAFLYK